MAKANVHVDGSICKEGDMDVPAGYVPCCENMEHRNKACHLDLRIEWWTKSKDWHIMLGDNIGIYIVYCPWCGTKLRTDY